MWLIAEDIFDVCFLVVKKKVGERVLVRCVCAWGMCRERERERESEASFSEDLLLFWTAPSRTVCSKGCDGRLSDIVLSSRFLFPHF